MAARASAPGPLESGWNVFWAGTLLAAVTVAAYFPVLHCGFIWDDDTLLTQNPLIKAADGLRRFWFTTQAPDYWPVTSTTLWLEWRLWGMQAAGYHTTNVLLHVLESLLLWGVLRRLRIPGAWFAALLFAVHPVNVESVAWIAQRKNLMAMVFYLASIGWFIKAATPSPTPIRRSSPSEGGQSAASPLTSLFYWLSLAAFLLALLSKGSVAPLPLVLLGLVAWRRRPTVRDWARLSPFFLCAGIFAAIDIWFQSHGSAEVIRSAGILERLLGAGAVIWFYLSKALWPAGLTFVYPEWQIQTGDVRWWLPILGAVAVTWVLWRSARRRAAGWARPLLFAWGYFCLMLVPAMGLTDVYFMKYSLVADHYQHLAIIGVLGSLAALFAAGWTRARGALRTGLSVAAALAVLALALQTSRQCGIYRDDRTLFAAILARNPLSWMAHGNLGKSLAQAGRAQEAIAEDKEALRLKPDYPEALNNLGVLLANLPGRMPEALTRYEQALRIDSHYAEAHYNLANALATLPGRMPEALEHYEDALRIDPNYAKAHDNLANALATLPGRMPEALAHYRRALEINPDLAEAHVNLANALAEIPGRMPEALAHDEQALRLNPDFAGAQESLANALATMPGRMPEALEHYEDALRLNPNYAKAHYDLANALATLPGRTPEALEHYEQALRINPDLAAAHYNLAVLDAATGRFDEAITHFELALKLNPALTEARDNLSKLRAIHP